MAEAAAATAASGADVTQERVENVTHGRNWQEKEHGEDEGRDEVGGRTQQAVVAAIAAMAVGEKKGEAAKEEEEEEGEKCAVCLNTIDSDDVDNPAGPPLTCSHRYHAFCLHFWVKRCASKSIEPTCPYCRAPVQEMVSDQSTTA